MFLCRCVWLSSCVPAWVDLVEQTCSCCGIHGFGPHGLGQGYRLHCDYAGPFLGHRFLVVINAYSQVAGSMPNNFNDINSYCGKTVGSFCTVWIARDLGH